MLAKILSTIQKYKMLDIQDHVIIGLSGGADSVALLYGMLHWRDKYSLILSAVHVNHGIRDCSADDEQFVATLCQRLAVPLSVYHYDVVCAAKDMGIGLEEAGRVMRYQAFSETLMNVGAHKIAVAHNMNDNAETVLMRIFRGTGLKGMCGIPPVRDNIIRPLIETGRNEIERYLEENHISYVTDQTNLEITYTRNKIRLQVLPLIQSEINPGIIETLARGSEIASEEDCYLDSMVGAVYRRCSLSRASGPNSIPTISITAMQEYPAAIKRRIIRYALMQISPQLRDITSGHVNDILLLTEKETGKSVSLPYGIRTRREYDYLLFSRGEHQNDSFCYDLIPGVLVYIEEINKYAGVCLNDDGFSNTAKLKCLCTREMNYDRMKIGLQIRTRRPGDRIQIAGVGSKKIKDYFIDAKLPRDQRDRIPLIAHGSDILWILDGKSIANNNYRTETGATKVSIQIWGAEYERKGKSTDIGARY